MSAELEVYSGTLRLLQMIGLVVQKNGVLALVCLLHQLADSLARRVGAVVAADNAEVFHHNSRVAQQVDACLTNKLLRLRLTTIVLMIAQTGIDRSLQTAELLGEILL